ncbi:2OG-Fe(II) oxygenase [Pseudomonas antarctica]|uniref:2OG-Fe(II) oxygenase n=1 Tax=Pseudomonas antarctica TaxID=219572 RepID=UPI0039C3AC26
MTSIPHAIERLDWQNIRSQLDQDGFAVLDGFLESLDLLERDWGATFDSLRHGFYPYLARISNQWNPLLQLPYRYPPQLHQFQAQCLAAGQRRERSQLMCLREDDSLQIRQDADGEHVFALQLVAVLSSPGKDFTGGEFVLIEQRPRMQSRPMVVPLQRGDIAIIATAQRPFKGSKGYYRVNMKHAISRVTSGERLGFVLSFHFAPGPGHDG